MDEQRKYLLGYGVGDLGLEGKIPRCKPIQPQFTMTDKRPVAEPVSAIRRPMSTDLGCAVPWVAPIVPDTRSKLNQQVSVMHRLATGHEVMQRGTKRVLASLMSADAANVLPPASIDFSWEAMEEKLRSRHKNQKYIDDMRVEWEFLENCGARYRVNKEWDDRMSRVDGFIKEESYPNYKAPRNICAASNAHKVFLGPWFDLLEKLHSDDPTSIKAIPVKDRIAYVRNRLEQDGITYAGTDHTRFESGVSSEWMQLCIVNYIQPIVGHLEGFAMFKRALMRCCFIKTVNFKEWKCTIKATQFSGTRFTAFLNWLINKYGIKFVAKMSKCTVDFIAEGDDAVIAELRGKLDPKWYQCLCQDVKFERSNRLGDVSFVGNLYSESLDMLKDPWKVLVNFGWSTSQYTASNATTLKTLARVKAHSLIAELPACPILTATAETVLRLTEEVESRVSSTVSKMRLNEHQRDKLQQLMASATNAHPISLETRLVFEDLFGIPVALQESVERDLSAKQTYGPLHEVLPIFDFMPDDRYLDAVHSYGNYVVYRVNGAKVPYYHVDFDRRGVTYKDFAPIK